MITAVFKCDSFLLKDIEIQNKCESVLFKDCLRLQCVVTLGLQTFYIE